MAINNKVKSWFFLASWFFAALTVGNAYAVTDKIIAIVNEGVITQSELYARMAMVRQHLEHTATVLPSQTELKKKILDDLINKELQLQLAARNNMKVSDEEIDEAILGIAKRNRLSLDGLKQELQKQNVKYGDFRKQIHDDMLIGRLEHQAVGQHAVVSEQEVDDFLKHAPWQTVSKGAMDGGGSSADKIYHVLDVLVPISTEEASDKEMAAAKKVVAEILTKLHKGVMLEQAVKEAKFGNKELKKDDLGWRRFTELPDIFAEVVAKLKPKDAAGPIVAPNGLHILILLDVRGNGRGVEQSEMKLTREEARNLIYQRKMAKALAPWLAQLRATAYVKVLVN